MINNKVLISNHLLSNTNDRANTAAIFALGADLNDFDLRDDSIIYNEIRAGIFFPYTKVELVLLPPGLHAVEMGVRIKGNNVNVNWNTFTVELVEYAPGANIKLEYPE
ncbi:unnamed protein product [Rotaria magnacalcarata]|uniref:Uncharacterized protein n=1 Tax=Rotaria magnacalcarata TaxID=392030 RepID=A0A814RHX4_9BILA|nr:unnamed protein product [Rotaria magnacalcarata]CAF1680568.1 unnamed protein product [Rotaria magnacalcarata]CAF2186123.1 unnamed protein product [Rotaria magnacalcarata]CAF3803700.1 unnamed protein product [Rotaria magnacalcarata]CAF3822118.1 unnamed protein product [Rotaria magnacalcarata]